MTTSFTSAAVVLMDGHGQASELGTAIRSIFRPAQSDGVTKRSSAAFRLGAAGFASVVIGLTPVAAWPAPITYNINIDQVGLDVTGTITTDGTIGALTEPNFTDFDLDVTFVTPLSATITMDIAGSSVICGLNGCGFTATASDLLFGTDPIGSIFFAQGGNSNSLRLQGFIFNGQIWADERDAASGDSGTQIFGGNNEPVVITTSSVPEPGSVALVALALGGLATLRRRRRQPE